MDELHQYIQTLSSLNENVVVSYIPRRQPPRAAKRTTPGYQANVGIGSLQSTSGSVPRPLHRAEPSSRPKLPLEVLELVLSDLNKVQLIPILQVNRAFYSVAVRLLYRTLIIKRADTCVILFRHILKKPTIQTAVRTLDINLSSSEYPIANFYRLLQKVLQRLMALTSLSLDFPKIHSPVWILDGCPFFLRQLSTSMQCSQPLAHFLDSQPDINNLTLRGFQSDSLTTLPYLHAGLGLSHKVLEEDKFVLQPDSLPRLTTFNAIHAGAAVVASVVSGRPVEVVSIPLFSNNAMMSLDALSESSVPLRRLSVISFDPNAPSFIFEEMGRRFPKLESMHIVVLLAEFTIEILMAASPLLKRFSQLKYITCVATSPEDTTRTEEYDIACMWHEECPTLQTIILPRGRVWFLTPGKEEKERIWSCLED